MNRLIPFLAATILIVPTFVGADTQSRNLESVLLEAASAGQTDIVKSFLDNGANIEVKNELGATPLIFASAKGQNDVVALLLERGADVNARTTTGITPLMAAASGGYTDIVKLLLAKGANVSAKDKEGRTALSMAEAAGDSEVADLLKSADKGSHPQERSAAQQPRGGSRQQSHDYSDFSSADSQSEPTSDLGQGFAESPVGPQAGRVGDLLNNPTIQQAMSRVLGAQQSGPGNVAAIQNPQELPANAAPAAGAGTTVTANPDGSTSTVTKNPDGSTSTVTARPNGTTITETKKPDGSTTTVGRNQDGSVGVSTTDKNGVQTITGFDSNGKKTFSATIDNPKTGAGSSTTFDSNGKVTRIITNDGKGTTVATKFGPDGRPSSVSTTTTDIATSKTKTTTVQCDAPGKCPETTPLPNAATLKAKQNQKNLTNAKQNNLLGNKNLQGNKQQSVADNKKRTRADVLNKIQNKPKEDAKAANVKETGQAVQLNPQPLPPSPSDKAAVKQHLDDKFKHGSNKKHVKEEFSKDAFSQSGNVKEKVIQHDQFSDRFSEGSKHKSQNWSAEQFKGKTKSHDFNMPAGSTPMQRFRY